MSCSVCGAARVFRKGRCDPCYRYFRKHGRDRSGDQVVSINLRRLERELKARLVHDIVAAGRQA